MNKLRIGFIGTGGFARRAHYPSLARIEQAEIVAVCGKSRLERVNEVANQYAVKNRYLDYRKMLEEVEMDAVFAIMRPSQGLTKAVCDVLAAGKHVFIEKPPAMSVAELRIMIEAARESGRATMVGFNRRHIPVLVEAKRQVDERGMCSVVATFYKHELKNDWSEGSKLFSNGIHSVDSLRWLAGSEVKEIVSATSRAFTDHDNAWYALIRFENGVIGTLLTNYSMGGRANTFELHGNEISAFVNLDESAVIYRDGKTKEPVVLDAKAFAGSDEFIEYYGLRAQALHFVESILAGRKPMPDFEDALKTMMLVERIEKGAM
jgi:predicted dehydrogenase